MLKFQPFKYSLFYTDEKTEKCKSKYKSLALALTQNVSELSTQQSPSLHIEKLYVNQSMVQWGKRKPFSTKQLTKSRRILLFQMQNLSELITRQRIHQLYTLPQLPR